MNYVYKITAKNPGTIKLSMRHTERNSRMWSLRGIIWNEDDKKYDYVSEEREYSDSLSEAIVRHPEKYFSVLLERKVTPTFKRIEGFEVIPIKEVPVIEVKTQMDNNKQNIFKKFSSFLGLGRNKKPAQEEDNAQVSQADVMEAIKAITKKEKTRERREKTTYRAKYKAKHKAKRISKKRFKVGKRYILRIKSKDGSREVIMGFECKKFIYTMNETPMNIVIMKQVYGEEGKKYTLNRNECVKFHVKYEPGLEVWPMEANWIPEKNRNV